MPSRFPAGAFEPVAITSRSGFDESVHFGAAVVVDETGRIVWSIGDPTIEVYPRSACKPIQADAMLRCGLSLTTEQLALACASHDGTPRQVDVVRGTLAAAGLDESALGNTPDLPLDVAAAEAILRDGGHRQPITMNCSGKHAAMVATCVTNSWPLETYLEPDHPLQLAITERIAELAGTVVHIGVDGCGAPAHVVALDGLARAFGQLARVRGDVWSAMTGHPELVAGERRDATRLMRAVPNLMAKGGAEGIYAAALPGGAAAAVKISDGAHRASGVVLAAALREVGVDVDPAQLGEPIRGHGKPVGTCRPLIGSGG
jgi:L-asparaginase II